MNRTKLVVGALIIGVLLVIGVVWRLARKHAAPSAQATTHSVSNTSAVSPTTRVVDTTLVDATARSLVLRQPNGKRRGFDRSRADGVRQRAALRRTSKSTGASTTTAAPIASVALTPMKPKEEKRRREYLNEAVKEQYFPVARVCYEELLRRQPKAAGKVVLSFAIVGDGEDGVVDHVELTEGTTMNDTEFTLCMRESMYAVIFEPPPEGAAETTVVYPLELAP